MDQWQPNGVQAIFLVFYAIFWGAIFSVQPRWKAFHWPLFFRAPHQARYRTLISVLILNLVPILFFLFGMWALGKPSLVNPSGWLLSWEYVRAVVAAFAIFGIFRIWLGIIELWPECFYAPIDKIPEKYRHVEPTFRRDGERTMGAFAVDLGIDTGCPNVLSGLIYLMISIGVLSIR